MKRKLKKLEQILAESPDWVIDRGLWRNSITKEMFKYFGDEHNFGGRSSNELDGNSFEESWFEQPVKKKLYAYRSKIVFQDYNR